MKPALFIPSVVMVLGGAGLASISNIDSIDKFGWGENIGWMNWQHDTPNPGDGLVVTATHLAGFVWAENVGWMNLGNGGGPYANNPADSSTFGVNIDVAGGDLSGLAWGENIGWINFDTATALGADRARFDNCNRRFAGYAWGENVGWINLNDSNHFVAIGPCADGDFECDGDVALDDYAEFEDRFMGPNVLVECSAFDTDADGDIDVRDFADLQNGFTGEP